MSVQLTEEYPIVNDLRTLCQQFDPITATKKEIKEFRQKLSELKNTKYPKK